jgi:hypothetical protein
VRKPQFGKRRLPIRRTRKGTIPVRVETETVTGQDAAEVSAAETEQFATEIDEPEDTGDAENTRDAEHIVESHIVESHIVESEDTSSDDTERRTPKMLSHRHVGAELSGRECWPLECCRSWCW